MNFYAESFPLLTLLYGLIKISPYNTYKFNEIHVFNIKPTLNIFNGYSLVLTSLPAGAPEGWAFWLLHVTVQGHLGTAECHHNHMSTDYMCSLRRKTHWAWHSCTSANPAYEPASGISECVHMGGWR